ncbi:Gfo/Idh/MocA family protein [Magnetospirillum gryphiswaldense]|uniref:Gfo/Idh/MocA family protein n=1 Tax=Magnetospirillum gryphiswaldense TaxID=55518 RepID=UPI001F57EF30|nr:Gfo/Idh/MocA family oxidoreductase [Magnetospirillum gryphiswaldense]
MGIAGYGVVGRRRRAVIDSHPGLITVAACDRNFADGDTRVDGLTAYTEVESMLASETLDVLFVCLTNDVAAAATIAGLQRGLHVFCEKPPGRDVADIRRVIEVEKAHPQLKLKYGFNHRYHESIRDALALLRSNELGRLINMRAVYGKSKIIDFRSPSHWRTKRAVAGGGILLDQGIHMLDLMRLFGGEFTQVQAIVSNDHWHHDVEDNAYVLMRSDQGVVALMHSTATEWRHRFRLEMSLERGSIVLGGILTSSKSYGAETITVSWKTEDDAGDPMERVTRYNLDSSWKEEVGEFAEAVLNGAPIFNGSSDDALKTMELVYRIYCADPQWKERWGLSENG